MGKTGTGGSKEMNNEPKRMEGFGGTKQQTQRRDKHPNPASKRSCMGREKKGKLRKKKKTEYGRVHVTSRPCIPVTTVKRKRPTHAQKGKKCHVEKVKATATVYIR